MYINCLPVTVYYHRPIPLSYCAAVLHTQTTSSHALPATRTCYLLIHQHSIPLTSSTVTSTPNHQLSIGFNLGTVQKLRNDQRRGVTQCVTLCDTGGGGGCHCVTSRLMLRQQWTYWVTNRLKIRTESFPHFCDICYRMHHWQTANFWLDLLFGCPICCFTYLVLQRGQSIDNICC